MKTKKQKIKSGIYIGIMSMLILTIISLGMLALIGKIETKAVRAGDFINNPIDMPELVKINVSRAKQSVEPTMKEWVKNEILNAGLDWDEAKRIIEKESSWREDICIIEPNNTISCGIWQLNTVHNKKGLTNACKVDYRCSTKYAIKINKDWGGWCAWTAAKKLGYCK